MLENQPADINATHLFTLYDLNGTTHNNLFIIDSNGSLRTSTIFDYETNASSYSIQVRATDDANTSFTKLLSVSLTNIIEDLDGDGIEDFYDPDIDGDGFSNQEEIAYGSDPLDASSVANVAPDTITATSLIITENEPAGTIVGDFNATDPDIGAILTFSLPSNPNFPANQLFAIDQNGTLRSNRPLDYEAAPIRRILVRVTDQHSAFKESNFVVSLTDLVENQPPSQISLSSYQIEENLPVGSLVGYLSSRDPDDPNSTGLYNYQIITGTLQNPAFSIDTNGTLRLASSLDFETQSVHTLLIRSTDSEGAFLDQNISIQVVDAFIPTLRTRAPSSLTFTTATLQGRLLDQGSSVPVLETGFLVSMDPEPLFESNNSIIIQATNLDQNGSFSGLVQGLTGEGKYFYRAYSKNAEGVGYGSVYDFTTLETTQGPSWAQASPADAAKWWTSPWLGAFYLDDSTGWIMHQEMGWLFPMEVPGKGVWLWHASLAGSGRMNHFIHSFMGTAMGAGFISTVPKTGNLFFTIMPPASGWL